MEILHVALWKKVKLTPLFQPKWGLRPILLHILDSPLRIMRSQDQASVTDQWVGELANWGVEFIVLLCANAKRVFIHGNKSG